jgi:DNA polymerase-3 subunit gamma/tau
MSYQVLARRWRPQTFDEVVGQQHVTITLRNALEAGRLPHAILLSGPRGIGKTSIARILAKSLNCDRGPTPEPCGECSPCREIAASSSMDVQEIDAASHTGVENVREVLESIRYAAAPGKHRIFIIDEVHMLSQAAFNALLKTLEEPPPRSLFVFATTDPQKIPATVLSRVQRFDLKRLGPAELLERLREIASSESIEISEGVLRALVREADGSLRDAQTLLDRLVSGVGTTIRDEEAIAILDLIDRRILEDIVEPVIDRDPGAALAAVRRALDKGIDPVRLTGDLLEEIRNLMVARLVDDPAAMIPAAPAEVEAIQKRAQRSDPDALDRLFRVLSTRAQELAFAPRPAQSLEMAVVRLATLPEAESLAELLRRLDALGGTPDGPNRPPPGADRPQRERSGGATPSSRGSYSPKRGPRPGPSARRPPAAPARPEPDSEPAPAPSPGSVPAPGRGAGAGRPDPERMARIRQEAKTDPAVRRVVDVFDAELQHIRLPDKEDG